MSPNIQQAIVAAEDNRFYQHHGVDPKGVARAFVANARSGGVSQGASTLTMQYVRMALRDSAQHAAGGPGGHRADQPAQGPGDADGAGHREGADQGRRSWSATSTRRTSATGRTASTPPRRSSSPRRPADLDPRRGGHPRRAGQVPLRVRPGSARTRRTATGRRNYVLDRMTQLGYLSPDAAAVAKSEPIRLQPDHPAQRLRLDRRHAQRLGLLLRLRQELVERAARVRREPAGTDGQAAPGRLPDRAQPRPAGSRRPPRRTSAPRSASAARSPTAIVVTEPGTGRIKAMAVNRTYSLDRRRQRTQLEPRGRPEDEGATTRTRSPRCSAAATCPGYQAGSTFKMFTMLAALDAGMPLSTAFNSPLHATGRPSTTAWCPSNASGAMTGRQTMWSGFGKSVNTYFVQLEEKIGAERAVRLAEQLGLRWRTDVDRSRRRPARRRSGARSPWASPTPPRWRWPTRTPRSPPTAGTASRCRSTRSPTGTAPRPPTRPPAGIEREVAKPRCRQVVNAGRGAGRHRRGALPHRRHPGQGQLRWLVDRGQRPSHGRTPGRRQDRHHGQHPVRLVRRLHPGAGGGELHRRPGQSVQRGRRRAVPGPGQRGRRDPAGRPQGHPDPPVHPTVGRHRRLTPGPRRPGRASPAGPGIGRVAVRGRRRWSGSALVRPGAAVRPGRRRPRPATGAPPPSPTGSRSRGTPPSAGRAGRRAPPARRNPPACRPPNSRRPAAPTGG